MFILYALDAVVIGTEYVCIAETKGGERVAGNSDLQRTSTGFHHFFFLFSFPLHLDYFIFSRFALASAFLFGITLIVLAAIVLTLGKAIGSLLPVCGESRLFEYVLYAPCVCGINFHRRYLSCSIR